MSNFTQSKEKGSLLSFLLGLKWLGGWKLNFCPKIISGWALLKLVQLLNNELHVLFALLFSDVRRFPETLVVLRVGEIKPQKIPANDVPKDFLEFFNKGGCLAA